MNPKTAFWCVSLLIISADMVMAATPGNSNSKAIHTKLAPANKPTAANKPAGKRKQAAPEQATTIAAAHAVQTSQYTLTGDSQGVVTLKNAATGAVMRTFQMDEDVQVREVFLLDKGATVGAAQLTHTLFWNVATGNRTGRIDERAYGFSHTQTCFFTQNPADNTINLYAYPTLNKIGQLSAGSFYSGPDAFLFSPDDHYLAVLHDTRRPEVDEDYPKGPLHIGRSMLYMRMYNLQTVQEITLFSKYNVVEPMGTFSADSRFYNLTDTLILTRMRDYPASFQFEMATELLTKLP